MKRKNFILVAFLLAIVCVGIWWFQQPAPVPVKVTVRAVTKPAAIPEGQYPIDPKSPALHPPPQPAIVPPPALPHAPNPADSGTPLSAPLTSSDPHGDLKTALPDMARLWRDGDLIALMKTYMPPDELDKVTVRQMVDILGVWGDATDQDAQMQQMREAVAQALESIQGQTPVLNATGDEATFMTATHLNLSPGHANDNNPPMPMVMVKINGKWYMKGLYGN